MICSLNYIVKDILQRKIFDTLQTPGVKIKRISELRKFCVNKSLLKVCTKFLGKFVLRVGEDYVFVNENIMQIIKDKNKIGPH